jgi:hypothetical protein
MERGSFKEAREMVNDACNILEIAVETGNHPGYYPQYLRRLTASLYSICGSIEYELNMLCHGRQWFQKADLHRMQLLEDDTMEMYDIQTMALNDGNIALSQLAEDNALPPTITTFTMLVETFGDSKCRAVSAANLSIAYRLQGNLEKSLEWCNAAYEWTLEDYGDGTLVMAL